MSVAADRLHVVIIRSVSPGINASRTEADRRGDSMTTLSDRPNTALLVVDVQNNVVAGAHDRERVIANIAALVGQARAEGARVIWVQHFSDDLPRDSEGWQYVPELTRDADEPLVHKEYGDSFEATDLEDVLAGLKVGRLIVAGAQTDACIRSTLHGAIVRGYDATLVSDAHTTEDQSEWGAPTPDLVIAHTNLYWTYHEAPGRRAGTVSTDEVDFAGAPG
jgi:nicotinamidase-related amidase